MKMRSELTWSLMDPKPILVYIEHLDEYLVYWNGIAMTHSMALCMSMEYIGIYPTPEMKIFLEKNYEKIYYAGGFGTRKWDEIVEGTHVYAYLKKIMSEHLAEILKKKEPHEILIWFDYSRARMEISDG